VTSASTRNLERYERASDRSTVPAWAVALARLMDDALPIPGTTRRIGLDAIIGFLIPGVGDVFAAGSGVVLIVLAFVLRVPGVVLARMALNVGIDALVGAIPLFGDVFDARFKSNRMNVDLIERFARPGAKARPSDYVFVVLILATVLVALLVPLVAVGWVTVRAFERFGR
jgi:hypothetical protein